MTISQQARDKVESVAGDALALLTHVADTAAQRMREAGAVGEDVLTTPNSWTSVEATRFLNQLSGETHRNLVTLTQEPAVARIIVEDDAGNAFTYYISRGTPLGADYNGARLASYRAPVGRLAALPVGAETTLPAPGGAISVTVSERTLLKPTKPGHDWDSVETRFEGGDYGPLTVASLRALLKRDLTDGTDLDLVEQLLAAEDAGAPNVWEGIRRTLITKMGLRDQPVLDRYQDDIFRLPLDSRLLILGPPGTGKTTTLIRRLGQKLDPTFLTEDETDSVDRAQRPDGIPHAQSWIMFTPTDLLKQYVKEAFAREGIPASDLRIRTWADYRRDVARNTLGILKTAAGGGPFVMREARTILLPGTVASQIAWFSDFDGWQRAAFWDDLRAAARALSANPEAATADLGRRLLAVMETADRGMGAGALAELVAAGDDVQGLLGRLKASTDKAIHAALNLQLNQNKGFVEELSAFLSTLASEGDDPDDPDADEDEDAAQPKTGRVAVAITAYTRAVRAQALAQAQQRSIGRQTRNGRLLEWLSDRSLAEGERLAVGESLLVQSFVRRFVNPVQRYVGGIPARYRRFRRLRQSEAVWYRPDSFAPGDLDPLEVDVVMLAVLRAAGELARDRRVARDLNLPAYTRVREVGELYRNQVLVDEAADFSPIQLACMAGLATPGIQSFFACGDFNQRVTAWGSRSVEDVRWACPGIEVRTITVSYRQSRQLNDFARQIILVSEGEAVDVALPEHVDNEGVAPVLGRNLADPDSIVIWLARRIAEIEACVQQLPSVAVLVNGEDEVQRIAGRLNTALADLNVRAVACPFGQVIGQDGDVRVFDVQHIKGLEFEAVFFVGVDALAQSQPELFDKYLYVGATRAATYLGVTIGGPDLPQRLAPLGGLFGEGWSGHPDGPGLRPPA